MERILCILPRRLLHNTQLQIALNPARTRITHPYSGPRQGHAESTAHNPELQRQAVNEQS